MIMELESYIRGRVVVARWDFQAPSLKYYFSKEVRDSKKCRVPLGFIGPIDMKSTFPLRLEQLKLRSRQCPKHYLLLSC